MAKLYFKYGSMGSSKTLDLLRTAYNYEERSQKPLLMTSAIDDRYSVGKITTRVGLEREALAVTQSDNLFRVVSELLQIERIDIVLIDEAMFLSAEQVNQLVEVVDDLEIPVICYGLRIDYRGKPFEGSSYLMALADEISEIKAICHCGKKATMNVRFENETIIKEGEQIVIGGNDQYTSLCRKCFRHNRLRKKEE